jgi:SAM-dependent methyltransferase
MTVDSQHSALRAELLKNVSGELTGQAKIYCDYALATNDRGRDLVSKLKEFVRSLNGLRILDVGSGYGGFCIQAALEGARCTALEVDERLRRYASLNLQDHPGVVVDWRSDDIFADGVSLPGGPFDIVTADNVIEHASYPARFIQVLAGLLAPDGLVYATMPNAYSLGQDLKDCHYGLFGVTLLDPDDAQLYLGYHGVDRPYDVTDYWTYPQYRSALQRNGLAPMLLNGLRFEEEESARMADLLRQARDRAREIDHMAKLDPAVRSKLARRVREYLCVAENDLLNHARLKEKSQGPAGMLLSRDYLYELWYVVARRHDKARLKELE